MYEQKYLSFIQDVYLPDHITVYFSGSNLKMNNNLH